MDVLLVGTADDPATTALAEHGDVRTAPAGPDATAAELDAVLSTMDARRLVVAGDLAWLNKVVGRLARRGLLADTPVGAIVTDPEWTVAMGLPADPAAAARVAATGTPTPRGLIRDDHGGVVLGRAELSPWAGGTFGVRAYVDDTELVNEPVTRLRVTPGDGQLGARVERRGLRRGRGLTGRALTVSCAQARLVVDGAASNRPQIRRTWWYEPDRWRLIAS